LLQGVFHRFKSRVSIPVKAEKMTPQFPFGIQMERVTIGPFSENNPATLSLDSLTVRASLFKALSKKIEATLNGNVPGGNISGNVKSSAIGGNANFKITSIGIQPLLAAAPNMPFQISGEVSANGKFHWDNVKPVENTGEIHLTSPKLDMPNFDLKLMRADFHFSKVEADIKLEKGGIINIDKLNLEGEPCGFEITGTITLTKGSLGNSSLDIEIVLYPTPEFEAQVPVAILKKNDLGFYSGHLSGTFNNPVFP
jgi:type II secretion system protein N